MDAKVEMRNSVAENRERMNKMTQNHAKRGGSKNLEIPMVFAL